MLRACFSIAGGALVLTVATSAGANGRFPASNQILFSPTDANLYAVRTTFGIVISHDAGGHWRWLCEDILGLGATSNEDPYVGITSANAFVAGLSKGMFVSPDTGCTWSAIGGGLAQQLVKDLVVRADDPHAVDAITSTYGPTAGADGGEGYAQSLFESTDDGATWSGFGAPIDPSALVTTVDTAPTDPSRIYVSAYRGAGPTRTASLFVSKDKGSTWVEHGTPFNPATETATYIAGVDPTNPDVVYLRSEGASRLVVTRDAGKTFAVVANLFDQMLGFALSSDGSQVYVGSVAAGLLSASASALQPADAGTPGFSQVSKIHVQCLATHGSDLWACSDEVSGFVAGVSHDGGRTFTPELHLLQIEGPLGCPSTSTAAQCEQTTTVNGSDYNPFAGLCLGLDACFDAGPAEPLTSVCQCSGACAGDYDASATCPDAGPAPAGDSGTPDAGTSHGGSSTTKSSCGCTVVGGGGALGGLGAAAALAFGLGGRRRRRR